MENDEAMEQVVLGLMKDRGLEEPKVVYCIQLGGSEAWLYCCEGRNDQRDWVVAI